MAACPILDFGAVPASGNQSAKESETDPQQIQNENLNRHLLRPPSQRRERSTAVSLFEGAEQSVGTTFRPLSVAVVESQIDLLPTSEDVEVPPTTFAHGEAKRMIVGAYVEIFSDKPNQRTRKPPAPVIGTDDMGGILVSWTSGNKYVAAKFASQPAVRSFVYFEQGAEHRALDLNEQSLLDRLRWLSGR